MNIEDSELETLQSRIERLELESRSHDSAKRLEELGLAGAVVIFYIMIGAMMLMLILFGAPKSAAEFGDMFGVVNTLFSGLAFWGLIVSLYMQRQELSLQRAEVRQTRIEMARTADSQERSLSFKRKAAQPWFAHNFYCQVNSSGALEGVLGAKNHGGIAVNLSLSIVKNQGTPDETDELVDYRQAIEQGHEDEFLFEIPEGENYVRCLYDDEYEIRHIAFIELFAHEHDSRVGERSMNYRFFASLSSRRILSISHL